MESVHRGLVVVADADGRVRASLGDPATPVYVRSAAKPFQALAVLRLLDDAGISLDDDAIAIATASHEGNDEQQIEAARLLALADLDERALATPPALPASVPTLRTQREATSLAHNCSGKHAAFLLAHTAIGGDPADYLDLGSRLQREIHDGLARACDAVPRGPGVDGCGAPAWILPLQGLAVGFARLAAGTDAFLLRVADAMRVRPDLVGAADASDTLLMRADARVVAKRGAEAVFGAGIGRDGTSFGVAVKVADGGVRAAGPSVAAVLDALGAHMPEDLLRPPVMGGGRRHGVLEPDAAVVDVGVDAQS